LLFRGAAAASHAGLLPWRTWSAFSIAAFHAPVVLKMTVAATTTSGYRTSVSLQRAHAAFKLGQVSRTQQVIVVTVLFDVLEPMANLIEKNNKHDKLQEVALGGRRLPTAALRLDVVLRR
jgi:hypothetical protein